MEINIIHNQECLEGLKLLPDESVDCIVTSPPYYALRDYKVKGQIGLEKTPEEFCVKIVNIFRECHRVLKKEGTCWINLGDSYWGSGQGYGDTKTNNKNNKGSRERIKPTYSDKSNLKAKDLIGIPWMVAFALRADGWYLRQDIIWHKPSVMPESVNDRCTKSHEYIFLLSKSKKYFFDAAAISEECSPNTHAWVSQDLANQVGSFRANGGNKTNGPMKACPPKYKQEQPGSGNRNNPSFNGSLVLQVERRNKRSVWSVHNRGHSEAHFATYPEELIVDCIKAGCPIDGIVLDPFMGSGTTALVARKLNRNYIGFELNPSYIKIAEKRLYNELGIFL